MLIKTNEKNRHMKISHTDRLKTNESAIEYREQEEATQAIQLFFKKMVKHFSTEKHYNM